VVRIEGEFEKDDIVKIMDHEGEFQYPPALPQSA